MKNKEACINELSTHIVQRQWTKAIAMLRALIALDPNNAQYYLRLGDYLLNVGNIPNALESYARAAAMFIADGYEDKAAATCRLMLKRHPQDTRALMLLQTLRHTTLVRSTRSFDSEGVPASAPHQGPDKDDTADLKEKKYPGVGYPHTLNQLALNTP